MRTEAELRRTLRRIDGRGYKAYQDLRGGYDLGPLELHVDHVQGDPFAAPSRMRLRVAWDTAGWPTELLANRVRRTAFEDLLARRVAERVSGGRHARGSGRSGVVRIDAGGQEVLERTAARATPDYVEARIDVGLPAAGRRVLGEEAESLLLEELPRVAARALAAGRRAEHEAQAFAACVENHAAIQAALTERGLVSFLAEGACLPRASGASELPLRQGAALLVAPDVLRVRMQVPHPVEDADGEPTHEVSGLAIPTGVVLIVGGGYHGKSTLLRAIERGIYPHVPGDGRELVATVPSAVKVRAEDGRRVVGCDIHPFVSELPMGRSTRAFTSDDASGSTSQAANIVEALEAGATALLLDEDTSATNFMVRDARMQALVGREREPITPFIDRVRELYEDLGVSTVLVMGGCGDYFEVADRVLEMHDFLPRDVTGEAQAIAMASRTGRASDARAPITAAAPRVPVAASIDPSKGRANVRVDARGRDTLGLGEEVIDLRAVEQLVDPSQLRAIGHLLAHAREHALRPGTTLPEMLDELETLLDEQGLDALSRRADLARPRRFEIAAALGRLRTLQVEAP